MLADWNHRFGSKFGFFLDARAEAAAKDKNGNFRCVHASMLAKKGG
jgi:hypothetical protein